MRPSLQRDPQLGRAEHVAGREELQREGAQPEGLAVAGREVLGLAGPLRLAEPVVHERQRGRGGDGPVVAADVVAVGVRDEGAVGAALGVELQGGAGHSQRAAVQLDGRLAHGMEDLLAGADARPWWAHAQPEDFSRGRVVSRWKHPSDRGVGWRPSAGAGEGLPAPGTGDRQTGSGVIFFGHGPKARAEAVLEGGAVAGAGPPRRRREVQGRHDDERHGAGRRGVEGRGRRARPSRSCSRG